jgi:hypothetical protein
VKTADICNYLDISVNKLQYSVNELKMFSIESEISVIQRDVLKELNISACPRNKKNHAICKLHPYGEPRPTV